ncbi:MAG: hypothetical protein Q4Q33_00450 [Eubacteriales bacterium]|nr:hypothetical protein [Eubacteriales bacterium]
MNIVQEDVLNKIISHYKETGENSFDSTQFTTVENIAMKELAAKGYISISSDILEEVSLTDEFLREISMK